MPKVVSRGTVSSSEQAAVTQSSRAVLRSYYCLCGDFVLVLQGKLERLPRRQRDGAYIIRSQPSKDGNVAARKYKLNAQPGKKSLIKRENEEVELRQNFVCSRCNSTVAYQASTKPAGEAPFLYIHKGALTELQGRVPVDAFEGEQELETPPVADAAVEEQPTDA